MVSPQLHNSIYNHTAIELLHSLKDAGIISDDVDAAYGAMIYKEKEKAVLQLHRNQISKVKIKKKGKTKEDKLYEYYYGNNDIALPRSISLADVFNYAINEKAETDNNSINTIYRLRTDFNRFFDTAFRKKSLVDISDIELKRYTQHLVNTKTIKKKAFLAYKGILNLIFGYAILVEIETGMRIAELCALKWEDALFKRNVIHIHSQQLRDRGTDGKNYRYVDYTKDEKGVSRGGRYYPITDTLHELFSELLSLQKKLQIKSEYVFCRRDGQWLKDSSY